MQLQGYGALSRIGSGAMGDVYRSVHERSGLPVAIKFIPASDDRRRDAFRLQEIRATASLQHPNLVRCLDVHHTDDGTWMVMPLYDGGTLKGVQNWDDLQSALIAVLRGLAQAHAQGVLHRDIKPANVLRDRHGGWALADFGVSSSVDDQQKTIVGTPACMAPEMLRRKPVGPSADLYSVGAMAWLLISGRPVFSGTLTDRQEIAYDRLPPLTPVFSVPEHVEGWLTRLLAESPAARPASAAEALALLVQQPRPHTPDYPTASSNDGRLRDIGEALLRFRRPALLHRESVWSTLQDAHTLAMMGVAQVVVVVGEDGAGRRTLVQRFAEAVVAQCGGTTESWDGERIPTAEIVVCPDLDDGLAQMNAADVMLSNLDERLWLLTCNRPMQAFLRRFPDDMVTVLELDPLTDQQLTDIVRTVLSVSDESLPQVLFQHEGRPGPVIDALQTAADQGRLRTSSIGYTLARGTSDSRMLHRDRPFDLVGLFGGSITLADLRDATTAADLRYSWEHLDTWFQEGLGELRSDPDRFVMHHDMRLQLDPLYLSTLPHVQQAAMALARRVAPDAPHYPWFLLATGQAERALEALLEDGSQPLARTRQAMALAEMQQLNPWPARCAFANALRTHFDHEAFERTVLPWLDDPTFASASVVARSRLFIEVAQFAWSTGNASLCRSALTSASHLLREPDFPASSLSAAAHGVSSGWIDLRELPSGLQWAQFAQTSSTNPIQRCHATFNIGRAFALMGREDDAQRAWDEALRSATTDATNVMVLSNLGELASRRGDYARAEQYLERSIQLAPNRVSPMAELNLLGNRVRQGKFSASLDRCRELVNDPVVRAEKMALLAAHQLLGLCLVDQHHPNVGHSLQTLHQLMLKNPKLHDPDFTAFAKTMLEMVEPMKDLTAEDLARTIWMEFALRERTARR